MRDRLIAVTMLCLLLGSMSAAYALTMNRQPPVIELIRVTAEDLSLTLPHWWEQVNPSSQPATPFRQFTDTNRPSRTLTLVRVERPEPTPSATLLLPIVERLLEMSDTRPAQSLSRDTWSHDGLMVAEWSGISPAADDEPAAFHLAANLTRDGRVHWVLYLTDRAGDDEPAQAVHARNRVLLRSIAYSADIAPDEVDDTQER